MWQNKKKRVHCFVMFVAIKKELIYINNSRILTTQSINTCYITFGVLVQSFIDYCSYVIKTKHKKKQPK